MKLDEKKKDTLFKVFIFGMIEVICFIVFLIISGLAGHLFWSIEQLTSTPDGIIIQIVNLIMVVDGIVMFVYLIIFIIMLMIG
ncbi:MAG: hypothetical protein ACFE8G_16035 [Candidatus Hermodarchaeota archaeon]